MTSSNISARPRPRSLARYIAASASRSIFAGAWASRPTAMPTEAEQKTSPEATANGLLPDLGDALGDLEGLLVGLDLGQHDELVAAQARHGVRGAHDLGQARADLDQQLVAGLVAERVVDRLEAVDVEQQHRDAEAEALGAAEGVLDAVEEQRAVGQAGERVVQRLVAHDRLRALAVERRGQQVGDRLQPLALLAGERADAWPSARR